MNLPEELSVRPFWGGRVEPIDAQARMIWECFQRLAARGDFLSLPWRSLNADPAGGRALDTFETLLSDMRMLASKGTHYGFSQDAAALARRTPCCATLSADLSLSKLGASGLGNDAVLMMGKCVFAGSDEHLPTAWLLEMGAGLVRDFVDIWHPDWVALDCLSVIDLKPRPRAGKPGIGFVTWLAPWVVDAGKLPRAPIREEYRGGTLIGINPNAKDPVGEATKLAQKIYAADILKPLPTVQPQWGDVPTR